MEKRSIFRMRIGFVFFVMALVGAYIWATGIGFPTSPLLKDISAYRISGKGNDITSALDKYIHTGLSKANVNKFFENMDFETWLPREKSNYNDETLIAQWSYGNLVITSYRYELKFKSDKLVAYSGRVADDAP